MSTAEKYGDYDMGVGFPPPSRVEVAKRPSNQHRITPASVLDEVRRFMPVIAYDPCYNRYALTDPIFESDGVNSNGLETDWNATVEAAGEGGIFVNPVWKNPFEWTQKLVNEAKKGNFKHDMLLWLPFYPETAAADLIWEHATRICCWGRRVNHPAPPIDANGNLVDGELTTDGGTMWPTWLSYFGRRPKDFEIAFSDAGTILWGWRARGTDGGFLEESET